MAKRKKPVKQLTITLSEDALKKIDQLRVRLGVDSIAKTFSLAVGYMNFIEEQKIKGWQPLLEKDDKYRKIVNIK